MLESMRDYLINTIQKTFEVSTDQAERLYQDLLQCTRNKNLVRFIHIIHLLRGAQNMHGTNSNQGHGTTICKMKFCFS